MKKIFPFVLALLCAVSCDDVITVTDNSFAFSGKHYMSGIENYISLTLEDGCPLQKYSVTYLIDSDPLLRLSDDRGSEVKSGSEHDFGSGPVAWKLPLLRKGSHSISFTLSTPDYSFPLEVPFEVTGEPFTIHGEVRTDVGEGTSTLLLSLSEGIADKEYHGYVYVDGQCVDDDGFKVNFRRTPIFSVVMPLLRPGTHEVLVEVSDDLSREEMTFLFEEPVRYPDIQVEISRSPSTGKTRLMVRSNPYSLTLAVRDSLVVKGRCDYVRCTPVVGKTESRTDYKELYDVVALDRFLPVTGRWYDLTDSQGKETLMTLQSQANTTWDQRWDSSAEGGWEYFETPTGLSYYKIVSSTHHMTLDFETLLGATVRITNSERDVIINGRPISVSYSYPLSASSR